MIKINEANPMVEEKCRELDKHLNSAVLLVKNIDMEKVGGIDLRTGENWRGWLADFDLNEPIENGLENNERVIVTGKFGGRDSTKHENRWHITKILNIE